MNQGLPLFCFDEYHVFVDPERVFDQDLYAKTKEIRFGKLVYFQPGLLYPDINNF